MTVRPWTVEEMAQLVGDRLERGSYVNLGIGTPTLVAKYVPPDRGVFFHCENGLIGTGRPASDEEAEENVIDAGSARVTLITGAAVVGHDVSFAIARGGHLDLAILGAFQVSEAGDLANWSAPNRPPGMGGGMDLATGAKSVWIMMSHADSSGRPKIVRSCDLPLTARGCVDRIFTELAIIDVSRGGLFVSELAPGVTPQHVRSLTEPVLRFNGASS